MEVRAKPIEQLSLPSWRKSRTIGGGDWFRGGIIALRSVCARTCGRCISIDMGST